MCALPTCIKCKHTHAHAHTVCRSYKPLAEALAMTETTPLLPKTFPPQHLGCPLSPRPHPVPWSSGLWLSLEATSVGSLIPEPAVTGPDDLRTTTSLENVVPTAPGRNLTESRVSQHFSRLPGPGTAQTLPARYSYPGQSKVQPPLVLGNRRGKNYL